MPNITVELLSGRSLDQRRRFVAEVTRVVVETLLVPAASVRIVLQEIEPDGVASGGLLALDQTST